MYFQEVSDESDHHPKRNGCDGADAASIALTFWQAGDGPVFSPAFFDRKTNEWDA